MARREMSITDIEICAQALAQTFETGEAIAPLSEQVPGLDGVSAYTTTDLDRAATTAPAHSPQFAFAIFAILLIEQITKEELLITSTK